MGEKYERVIDYLKPDPVVINDEYDLVLRNGNTVVLSNHILFSHINSRHTPRNRR